MLSDGDSKSFDALVQANVYGENVSILKEDCVNHVTKRMGTALRNLTSEAKSQGHSISGKGKLTAVKAIKIQNYYGRAIKDCAGDYRAFEEAHFCHPFSPAINRRISTALLV